MSKRCFFGFRGVHRSRSCRVQQFHDGARTDTSPIYKFNAPVNANATPSATDPGANTTVNCADGATLDPSGNFWVGDFNGRFLEFPVGSATFTTMAPSLTLTPGGAFTHGYDVKFGP